MTAPKTAKDFKDLYLAEAVKVKHMRKALNTIPWSGPKNSCMACKAEVPHFLVDDTTGHHEISCPIKAILAIPKSDAEKGLRM